MPFNSKVEESRELVLIVDDCPTNRFLLKSLLTKSGYEVAECADGLECLEFCKENVPSTILLDVMMPRMSGIDVCKELRKDFTKSELPIIMVTAKAEGEDVRRGIEVGANEYVPKPIDRIGLLARLDNQIRMSNSHKEVEHHRALLARGLKIQKAMGNVLPEGILIHNQQGQIVYHNTQLLDFCEDKVPATINEALQNLFEGVLLDVHSLKYSQVLEDPELIIDEEVHTSGFQKSHIRIISRPVELSGEERLRLWLWRDVSHTRALEEKIQQQVKLESLSLFASGVAHNFNNIMGSVLGAAELLQRTETQNKRTARCLEVIKQGVSNGKRLTQKMASIVKRDVMASEKKRESLANIVNSVCTVQEELGDRDITYVIEVDESLPMVEIDTINLADILINVIGNASDAVKSDGVVRIRSNFYKAASLVEVVVSDDGVGMDSESLEKVFEPFFSTKNLDVKNGVSMVGNGLGLWNVYNLLKACGGDIEIESKLGVGTDVKMVFPVSKP